MFTKRIIPCLDVNNGRVVKGVNFVDLKDAGDPVIVGAAYGQAGADELVFLDITASSDARATSLIWYAVLQKPSLFRLRLAAGSVPLKTFVRCSERERIRCRSIRPRSPIQP